MVRAYINGVSAVSPQKTFSSEGFPGEILEYEDTLSLKCIEPVYNEYIDPMASRRMGRIVKMGICAAIKCLKTSGIENPDAIITGTGFGCIEDTEKFLGSLIINEERLLNPTPFIQSTHNTVGSAIALKIKCNNYNNTYVHRQFSFEHALLDAMLQISENQAKNILVGGLDETTANYFTIKKRLGFWKSHPVNNLRLLEYKTKGSIAGEGVAFFMLGNEKNENTFAEITSLITSHKNFEDDPSEISEISDADLVLYGLNGNIQNDKIYYDLINRKFKNTPAAFFKHLCGEYDTAVSFALWLASDIIKSQSVPGVIRLNVPASKEIKNIVIFNHIKNAGYSLIRVSKC
jgi:3-oxoacyl-[acyl-carrier-protein] synthase II